MSFLDWFLDLSGRFLLLPLGRAGVGRRRVCLSLHALRLKKEDKLCFLWEAPKNNEFFKAFLYTIPLQVILFEICL